MGAETVIFHGASPVVVHHFGAVLLRSDTVHPMVFIGKTASGPAQYGHFQFFQGVEHIGAIALYVGDLRIFSYPESAVDAGSEVLSKLSINLFGNDFRTLVGQYGDLGTSLCGQGECSSQQDPAP